MHVGGSYGWGDSTVPRLTAHRLKMRLPVPPLPHEGGEKTFMPSGDESADR